MISRDRNTLDIAQQKLSIAPDVLVWPVRERGQTVYRIEIPSLHRFFSVGHDEYLFLSLLDGKTTIPQACGLAAAKLGRRAPSADQAMAIARWLLSNDLAHLASDPPPTRDTRVRGNHHQPRSLLNRINPFWIQLPLPLADRGINACAHAFRWFLDGRLVSLGLIVIVTAMITMASNWSQFIAGSGSLFHSTNWLWLLVTWVVLKLVHELGHAIACQRQGGSIREAGIVLVLFAPLAYVDVSSCWRLGSRWSRIAVAAAGMYVELLIAAIALLTWTQVDDPRIQYLLQNTVVVAGLSTLAFNANVLMRFDGYFMLADLIEIPNLYSKGASAVQQVAKRWITGATGSSESMGRWRDSFVVAYGILSLLWRVVVCMSLAIAASTMFAGAGISLTFFGLLVWLGNPISQFLRWSAELRRRSSIQFCRAIAMVGLSSAVIWATVCWLPIPSVQVVPALVRYKPETIIRSPASGFVRKIHIDDGARVQRGQLLVDLENRELRHELRQLEVQYAQCELRLRQATRYQDAGEKQILRAIQSSFNQRLDQLRNQVAKLEIRSPRDGIVVARRLETKIDSYFEEGDAILLVVDDTAKELVAMIRHDEIDRVNGLIGQQLPVRTAGFVTTFGRLDQVEPRADESLPAAALAATEGGSLAVRIDDESEAAQRIRLLHPHFRVRLSLASTTSPAMPAGARAEVWLGIRNDSIYQRCRHWVGQLWRSTQEARPD